MSNLSTLFEDKFLSSLLFQSPTANIHQRYALHGVDWQYAVEKLSSQGFPWTLLYYNLKKTNIIGELPEGIRNDLKQSYLFTLVRNLLFLDEFIKIQALFESKGIAVMPLKGMALLFCVYKDIGTRPMVDIDLLIKKEDIEEVKNLLLDAGYKEENVLLHYDKAKGNENVLLDMEYDMWYLKTLHRRKSNIYGIEQIWRHSRKIYLEDGKSARIMAPEDLLINITAHAAVDHCRPSGFWLYDIAAICDVHRENMQWDVFIDKVISYNLQISFYETFKLAKESFNGKIPQSIIDKLKPLKTKFLELRFYQGASKGGYIPKRMHLLRIFTSSSLLGKLRLIFFYLFPDKEFMVLRYKIKNKHLVYFYYPLRFISFFPKILKIAIVILNRCFKRFKRA